MDELANISVSSKESSINGNANAKRGVGNVAEGGETDEEDAEITSEQQSDDENDDDDDDDDEDDDEDDDDDDDDDEDDASSAVDDEGMNEAASKQSDSINDVMFRLKSPYCVSKTDRRLLNSLAKFTFAEFDCWHTWCFQAEVISCCIYSEDELESWN